MSFNQRLVRKCQVSCRYMLYYTRLQIYDIIGNRDCMREIERSNAIDLLRHVSHDWLNSLQLIKGYKAMGKMEKVKEIIDHIIQQLTMEANFTNINLPKLSAIIYYIQLGKSIFYIKL